jgi:nicotinate phosphoribosyltransferase
MLKLNDIYHVNLALLTDLYQMTMAYGYWKSGIIEREAVFNMYFRKSPFNGGFAIACGLHDVIDFLNSFSFAEEDLSYLSSLKGNDGKPLFETGFLDYLRGMQFSCSVDAMPEGTVVFPQEPLLRIQGPLFQCQLVETAILNIINFQTLIATKAARMRVAAGEERIFEFGLRRAQGIDGALAASRAAYIGGVDATSNVLAGRIYDIPVRGTHAHSWVMSFDSEPEAFEAYAAAMPNNCTFLVDTYDTLQGVRNAIEVAKKIREKGYHFQGIRLDSGDLSYLSIEARKMLDDAGFHDANIVASNDLDENIIESLHHQGAKVNVWGIGTKLVTGDGQPALGGVYKIAAIKDENGNWQYKVKLSEQAVKVSTPGIQQVRRFFNGKECIADMIFDELNPPKDESVIIDPMDMTRRKYLHPDLAFQDMLVPIFREGKQVYQKPVIHETKQKVKDGLESLHKSIKRFVNAHAYPVGLEKGLFEVKTDLILKLRQFK